MQLTAREKSICKFIALGKNNCEIARALYLSEHTVKAYISRLLAMFGVSNRTELAYILGRENIIKI